MIEFCGEVSNECKRYIQNDATKTVRFVVSMVTAMLSIPIILATIMWHWIFAVAIPLPIFFAILILIPQINSPMKTLNLYVPQKIIIDADTISIESEKKIVVKSVVNVKKIIDVGDWYQILFYFPHKNLYFVCQKNLITKGTIEEFEQLFEDKIVRAKLK